MADQEAEYKALRDEMMHLLNRIFILLAAMVGGSIVVFYRALEFRNTSPQSAFALLLALCVTLTAAIMLTYKMHEHIDKIRFYILVYHEPDSGCWHSRIAEFNKYRKDLPDLPRTHKLFFCRGDLDTISALYGVLVLVAVGMMSIFPPILFESYFCRHIGRWQSVFGALAILFLALLLSLRSGYNTGLASMERWWCDFKHKPAAEKTPPDVEDWGQLSQPDAIQRFGSAANPNIHLHCLVLDGVFGTTARVPVFHAVRAPTPAASVGRKSAAPSAE